MDAQGKGVVTYGRFDQQAATGRKAGYCYTRKQAPTRREARQIAAIGIWAVVFCVLQNATAFSDATAYTLQIFLMLVCSSLTVFNRTPFCYLLGAGCALSIFGVLFPVPLVLADMLASAIVLVFSTVFLLWGGVVGCAGWIAVSGVNIACTLFGWDAVPLELAGALTWGGVFFATWSTSRARLARVRRIQAIRKFFAAKRARREADILDAMHDASNAVNGMIYAASDFCRKDTEEKKAMLERSTCLFTKAKQRIIGNCCVTLLEGIRKVMRGEA